MQFFNFSTFSTVAKILFVTMPAASNDAQFFGSQDGTQINNPQAGKLLSGDTR
jgi:hypothetical protein